jgi:hypothetical protein
VDIILTKPRVLCTRFPGQTVIVFNKRGMAGYFQASSRTLIKKSRPKGYPTTLAARI